MKWINGAKRKPENWLEVTVRHIPSNRTLRPSEIGVNQKRHGLNIWTEEVENDVFHPFKEYEWLDMNVLSTIADIDDEQLADLRNKLSPAYALAKMILDNDLKTPAAITLIKQGARQTIKIIDKITQKPKK